MSALFLSPLASLAVRALGLRGCNLPVFVVRYNILNTGNYMNSITAFPVVKSLVSPVITFVYWIQEHYCFVGEVGK